MIKTMITKTDEKTILVVDDDQTIRETYVELFRRNNFKVLEAKDGVEGLDIATSQEGIDLIFTGIVMPRMDGFQLISSLKENTITANIPVIMNSHLGREEDRKKALDMGVKDFIIRGVVSPVEALKRINFCLGSNRKYYLKVDPFALNGQEFIREMNLPEDFHCTNCGLELSLRLQRASEGKINTVVECSECKKSYS